MRRTLTGVRRGRPPRWAAAAGARLRAPAATARWLGAGAGLSRPKEVALGRATADRGALGLVPAAREGFPERNGLSGMHLPSIEWCEWGKRAASHLDSVYVPSIEVSSEVDQERGLREMAAVSLRAKAQSIGSSLSSETKLDCFMCSLGSPTKVRPKRSGAAQSLESRRERYIERLSERNKSSDNLVRLTKQVAKSLQRIYEPQMCQEFKVDMSPAGYLGEGRQGVVRLASSSCPTRPNCRQKVAVKSCNKFRKYFSKEEIGSVRNEVKILQRLSPHPNVADFVRAYESPINIHIVCKYCPGGDLFSFLHANSFEPQPEICAAKTVRRLLSALKHVHAHGYAHLDVKLENVMRKLPGPHLDSSEIALVDFGHARRLKDPESQSNRLKRPVGSPSYASPEVVLTARYGAKSDVWSVGVIAFVLLQGYLPFSHLQSKPWKDFSSRDYYVSPFQFRDEWADLSVESLDFCRKVLRYDDKFRLTVDEAIDHPWIRQFEDTS